MDYKKTLDKIKGLFSTEKSAFKDIAGENGMIYRLSEDGVAVGSKIEIINEDGTLTPAFENTKGSIKIEGVEVIIENGVITEVKTESTVINPETGETAEKVEDLAAVEDKEEETPAPTEQAAPAIEEQITVINERIEKIEMAIGELVQLIQQSLSAVEDKQKQLEKEVEEFGKTPAVEPITKTNRFKFQKEQPKNEWVEKIRKQINKQ